MFIFIKLPVQKMLKAKFTNHVSMINTIWLKRM